MNSTSTTIVMQKNETCQCRQKTYRLLQGFRGEVDDWDWEAALLYSKAKSDDVTSNRVSNTLLKEALSDSDSSCL